jgi:ABC-type lipoprotein release transport system permease subunit
MSFLWDLRYSVRSLSRTPGLAAALIATVAIGIGTHTTMTGFRQGLMATSGDIPGAKDLVLIDGEGEAAVRQASAAFDAISVFRDSRALVTIDGHAVWMPAISASPELWRVLDVPAGLGDLTFTSASGHGDHDREPGAVISRRVWYDNFNLSPSVLGTPIAVNGRRMRIVGVAPPWLSGLYLGRPVDVWAPLDERAESKARGRGAILARMAAGRRFEDVRRELSGVSVVRYTGVEPDVQERMARVQAILSWAGAFVFLTAAANVAGFLLSRASRRSHETAARLALGATDRHLTRQVLADSLVVTIAGAVLGGFVGYWTATAFPALLWIEDAERLTFKPDVWLTTRSVCGYSIVMIVCALAPMLRIRQNSPMAVLRRSGSGQVTSIGTLRTALVITQMAVCCVLMIGTGVLLQGVQKSLRTLRAERLGEPIVSTLDAEVRFADPDAGAEYFRRVETEMRAIGGITSVAWTSTVPGGRAPDQPVRVEQAVTAGRGISVDTRPFPSGRAVKTLELKSGRLFGGVDTVSSCRVTVINAAAAKRYFDDNAVGRALLDASGRRIDIVGVVASTDPAASGADEPTFYFFDRQFAAEIPSDVRHEQFRIRALPPNPPLVDIDITVASAGYFASVGAPIVAGTGLTPAPCDTAVVNREAAHQYFNDQAVGGALIDPEGHRTEIVGVVDDGPLRVMERRADPMVFYLIDQHYIPRMTVMAGTPSATPELIESVTRRLRGVAGGSFAALPGTPPVVTLEEHLARTALGPDRIASTLVGASALIAVALALLGVYSVMADSVLQKKREIAVRLALGARGRKVLVDVLAAGVRIAGVGAAAGLAAAFIVGQLVAHSISGLGLPALWIWVASPVILTMLVAVASIVPARSALAVDPLTLTREE